jgi:hypothetical protein
MAGPLVVVLASLASAWLAVKSDDGVVAGDYYKRGLEINRKLPLAVVDPASRIGATITVSPQGEVRARVEGAADAPGELRLELSRPGATGTKTMVLRADADGAYVGALAEPGPGRWIVTLESSGWRLPTTVTSRLSDIRLGIAEH